MSDRSGDSIMKRSTKFRQLLELNWLNTLIIVNRDILLLTLWPLLSESNLIIMIQIFFKLLMSQNQKLAISKKFLFLSFPFYSNLLVQKKRKKSKINFLSILSFSSSSIFLQHFYRLMLLNNYKTLNYHN